MKVYSSRSIFLFPSPLREEVFQAFCCISTGIYGYPNDDAAISVLRHVTRWLAKPENQDKVR